MAIDGEKSKDKILRVAERLFAEKGYDGARIDEIAGEAKVNKALIYYYFKSKKGVLRELFQNFFRESSKMLLNYVKYGGLGTASSQEADQYINEYFAYYDKKKDILKIMLMESLKESSVSPSLFKLVDFTDIIDESEIDFYKEMSTMSAEEMNQMLVTEFFTGVMPLLSYVVFRKRWCEHFHISEKKLQEYYERAMEMTHMAYHRMREK
jgi:AcrR family transcriptional regulator